MPQKIGRYEIQRELGGGGMADVFLAHDPNFGREVVVKVIKPEFSANPEFRARFNREARVIANLQHEAIVPVFDFGEHDGQPFIVMRAMNGGTLADRLVNGPCTLVEVAQIVARIADALNYAHSRNVIHRDLKPGNILFDERGNAFLSDFGIAKLAEATTKLTGTSIIGTPAYMSPEQARAVDELDGRSDVYSLGVVIFELLTGELPYKAREPMGMLMAHASEPVPDIRKLRPDLPRESDALIKHAMAKKPNDRYVTTSELAEALSHVAKTKPRFGVGPVAPGKVDTPPRPQKLSTPRSKTPPGDLRPTVGPDVARPRISASHRPRGLLVILPVAFLAVCIVTTIIGSIAFLPNILANRTLQVTAVAIVTAKSSNDPITKPSSSSGLGIGSPQISEKDGMVMVHVPEGNFLMGSVDSDAQAQADEKPQHEVYLDAYWIDQTEVTNEMFVAFMNGVVSQIQVTSTGFANLNGVPIYEIRCIACSGRIDRIKWSGTRFTVASEYSNHPVTVVPWFGAKAYCERMDRRLPTEAEWEKAARGDDGRIFPWGAESPDSFLLNFNGNVGDMTDVGSYPNGASPYGALDMAGNVWEWVADRYDANYYSTAPLDNPTGPASGQYRVRRGGAWGNSESIVRAASRHTDISSYTNLNLGFRCASSP